MKINVKRIPADGEELEGSVPATILEMADADVQFTGEIQYRLHAQIQNQAVLVTGKLATPATLRCSRCLRAFVQPLEVGQFVFHRELAGEDFVDLTENLREDIILELPQRALCRPDCKGLCPVCGKDLNESACRCNPATGDLRWHALENIKIK